MNPDEQLSKIRERIDAIDSQLLELISERARCAQAVAQVKLDASQSDEAPPVFYRPEREAQVLRAIQERNTGPPASAHAAVGSQPSRRPPQRRRPQAHCCPPAHRRPRPSCPSSLCLCPGAFSFSIGEITPGDNCLLPNGARTGPSRSSFHPVLSFFSRPHGCTQSVPPGSAWIAAGKLDDGSAFYYAFFSYAVGLALDRIGHAVFSLWTGEHSALAVGSL